MDKGTFGDNLRREREMRGVSLDEISAATRIATRFLQAIENEQWDQLPGGVFNRGFVRAVAHYLGLDEENIVAEYLLAAGAAPTVPVWTGSPPAVTPQQPWLAWILAAIVGIAVVAGLWFGVRRVVAWRAARRAAKTATLSASVPDTGGDVSGSSDPGGNNSLNPAAAADPSGVTSDAMASTNLTTPDGSAPANAAAPIQLMVEADKKTRVSVDADDLPVFEGTMQAGENRTFTAKDRFHVSTRDAGALLLELNGRTLAPIGPSGHAGKATFTRDNLKGDAGGQN